MVRVKVDPGICRFVTVIDVKKLTDNSIGRAIDRELEVKIYSGCPNLDAFSQAIAKMKALDAVNLPKANLVLKRAVETLPHSSCPIPCGVIKACEAEIGFALKRDSSISFEGSKATQ
ncbi:MAG: hypothetical protein ABSB71_12245 [Candidatus Bathyarchaeia archaeon]|jgi:hypothetical protein